MTRAMVISITILFMFLGMNVFNTFNLCYQFGCPEFDTPLYSFNGVGHPFIDKQINPLLDPIDIIKLDNETIDTKDKSSINRTFTKLVSYSSPGNGIIDWVGFFGFVLPAARLIIDTFFFSLFGFPQFLVNSLYIPLFIGYAIGGAIVLIQVIAIIEFLTNRVILG